MDTEVLTLPLIDLEATWNFGQVLGQILQPGDLIGLDGPLGAGKTSLVQGIARGLLVPESVQVTSPTFTLLNQYQGRIPLYHVDLYRLDRQEEVFELGLYELVESGGVMAVEWLSRFPTALPPDRLEVRLTHDQTSLGRNIRIGAPSRSRAAKRLSELAERQKSL